MEFYRFEIAQSSDISQYYISSQTQ